MSENKFARSYHTFLLPFVCDDAVNETSIDTTNWQRDTVTEFEIKTTSPEQYRLDFATYQYFTPEARNLLFDAKYSYSYKLPDNAYYTIKKTTFSGKELTYFLHVKRIRMLLLDNRVGIFVLETENRDKNTTLDDICQINEYGRRINLPYITDGIHNLVADSISLLGKTEDFVGKQKKYLEKCNHTPSADMMEPIKFLIVDFIGKNNSVRPVIDDRMFVCCLIRDDELSESVKSDKIYSWDRLYQIGFIDVGSASCQSPVMREKILSRCIYDRWRDYGTIDIITHHSFVRITGEDKAGVFHLDASVYNPFLTQYVYLAIAALLQRANIMCFSKRCSDISEEISQEISQNGKVTSKSKRKIDELNSEYVDAQSRVFLHALTAQEQGIEEFEMLKRELYINESYDDLDRKTKSLCDLAAIRAEYEENRLLKWIAILGIPLAVGQIVLGLIELFLN